MLPLSRRLLVPATLTRGCRSLSTNQKLAQADVEAFSRIVGSANVITESNALEAYNVDWMRKYRGSSSLALRPGSTEEVSAILAYCNERRLSVVPQGGNTGLVGGSVPVDDEIILSLSRMNSVRSVDTDAGHLVCDAGCVLEVLQSHVMDHGFTMPLDLGAKGSCQIGGNLATNAGGLRYLRYGSLHGSVLGLEAVLADGTVLDCLTSLKKDNTGYDIKVNAARSPSVSFPVQITHDDTARACCVLAHISRPFCFVLLSSAQQLFIGSEGTLGVITACALALPQAPKSVQLAFLGVQSYDAVLQTFAAARGELGEVLSAVEFIDAEAYNLVTGVADVGRGDVGSGDSKRPQNDAPRPLLEKECRHYVLVELSGSCAAHDQEKLEWFLSGLMESGVVVDGTIAQDETQSKHIWRIREGITSSLGQAGAVYKYDVSLRLAELYQLVEDTRTRLKPLGAETVAFGHLGDGARRARALDGHRTTVPPCRLPLVCIRAPECRCPLLLHPALSGRRQRPLECLHTWQLRGGPHCARCHRALCVRMDCVTSRVHLCRARNWRHEAERLAPVQAAACD